MEEIKQNQTQLQIDFQKEKNDITDETDRHEMDHLKEIKIVKEKCIEQEVEARRLLADSEKVNQKTQNAENTHKT